MAEIKRIPVAIIGGGPVGLMLALFLDMHGARSVVFNTEETTRWHPKGSTESSRTMEHFRRIGIAGKIRAAGLPPDHPTDVAYFTRFGGIELARLPMPSANDVAAQVAAAPKTDQVPEPTHRANQMYVDRLLLEHARTRPNITLRFGWRVDAFEQDAQEVRFGATREADGAHENWHAQYLIGCDGGRSMIRRTLGIKFLGEAGLEQRYFGGRTFSTYLRAPSLYREFLGKRRAWQYWAVNPEIRSTLIAVNGTDEFLLRTRASRPDQPPDDALVGEALRRCTGTEVEAEIVAHEPWTAGVALVAERFADRRVLLAGDAVHLFTPTGGFGMNTGIDDASNLAWKLAAVLQGWGGPALLGSYEAERMPIAARNTDAARKLAVNIGDTDIEPEIELTSAAGEKARQAARAMLSTFAEQFASIGVQLGGRYDGSPLFDSDAAAPADSLITYTPTSIPGGRAPHLWLDHRREFGSSLYDRMGAGFTLLRFTRADGVDIIAAAQRAHIPLKVTDIPDTDARDLYERDLVLVRPDQYVVWRGNSAPPDAGRLFARATGYVR